MPQYLVTCPECQHQARVRFIRKGATATCVQCQYQYRIDAKSLTVETDADTAIEPASDDPPFELLRDKLKPSTEPAAPAPDDAFETPQPEIAAPEPPREPMAAAAATTPTKKRDPAAAKARLAARSRASRKGSPMLIAAGVIVAIGLTAALVGLVFMDGKSDGPSEIVVTPPDRPSTPDKPDPPGPDVTPDPIDVPTVTLQVPPLSESRWQTIDPPTAPISARHPEGALWNASLVPGVGDQLKLLALYIADSDAVYRAGNLRVQLLDENQQAFAEFSGVVPVVCAAQGLQFTAKVPSEWNGRIASIVSRFDTVDPLPNAVPLETVDSAARLIKPEPVGWRTELVVRNPYLHAVSDPTIVVDLLDVGGTVAQTWRGSLRATIGPGQSLTFQTVIPVATSTEPERITLRSYARRTP